MSSQEFEPTVVFQPSEAGKSNTDFSPTDEGAILLKHQAHEPGDEDQDMASPSVNAEPGKNRMSDGSSIVDMVLVYEVPDPSTVDEDDRDEEESRVKKREFYIDGLKNAGLIVEIDPLGGGQSEVSLLIIFDFQSWKQV